MLRVAPFTADAAQAVESLKRIEDVSSDLVLPGHGDPWTGGAQEAASFETWEELDRHVQSEHSEGQAEQPTTG
jgi:glyoxylase-like metal-dependent hydrolase (beta-lactamase superfamily II)